MRVPLPKASARACLEQVRHRPRASLAPFPCPAPTTMPPRAREAKVGARLQGGVTAARQVEGGRAADSAQEVRGGRARARAHTHTHTGGRADRAQEVGQGRGTREGGREGEYREERERLWRGGNAPAMQRRCASLPVLDASRDFEFCWPARVSGSLSLSLFPSPSLSRWL